MEDETLLNGSPLNTIKEDPSKKKKLNDEFKSNGYVNKTKGLKQLLKNYDNKRFYNTGLGESKYDENLNWNAEINENNILGSLNEHRAQEQGFLPTMGAGLGRVSTKVARELLKTAGAVIGGVAGIVGNVGDLITGEDNTDFLSTTFNNDFIRATDKAFDTVNQELLPVYVSDTVQNGGFFDKISSSEFWATEGADGAGYLISAFAPGAALKAIGAGNKIFTGATKLTALRYGKSLEVARRGLTKAGMTSSKIDDLIIPAANTFFEAGAEAKGVSDSMDYKKPEFVQNNLPAILKKLNVNNIPEFIQAPMELVQNEDGTQSMQSQGLIPNPEFESIRTQAMTEVEKQFQEQKGFAMRNTFLTNLAILAGPNYIQAKLIYGKNGASKILNNVQKSPIKQGLKRVGETFLSEGSEEVAQTSTEHRQVKKGLKGELSRDAEMYKDISPAEFGIDFIKTLGTTEGQIAGFLGGILGSPISVVQGYKQDSRDKVKTDALRGKIETTGVSLNDINLPIYKTKTVTNPETGEEIEDFELDEQNNKILIPENVAKVKQALDKHENISKLYDLAVELGDVEAVDRLKKYGEHELIMNFINEDEMSLDALKQHLETTLPVNTENKKESNDNLKRQNELIEKAKYLQQELVSFRDMSTNIIKLENSKATPTQVENFMEDLGKEFLKETSELYDLRKKLNKLQKDKSNLENQTTIDEIDNPLYEEGVSSQFDKKIKVRSNPRLDLVNGKLKEIKDEIKEKESFLNYGVWNSKVVNGAFNASLTADNKLKEAVSPEVVDKSNDVLDLIQEATSLEELNNVDLQNNPGFMPYYNAKKAELESIVREERETQLQEETLNKEEDALVEQENLEILNDYRETTTVGEVVPNPFTNSEATVEKITKNSITLKDAQTGEENTYTFQEISDENSADDINVTIVNPVPSTITYSDHKSVAYDNANPSFTKYLMSTRNKKGDVVTFELRIDGNPEALRLVREGIKEDLVKHRDFLIKKLALNFIYNQGEAKSWSSFDKFNATKLRENIIDSLIEGYKLEDLSTTITNQETPSFNTKFEKNNKPVINNPLKLDYVVGLDPNNPENKITLYNVNINGDIVLVSNNDEPLESEIKKELKTQKGQVFLVIKNPKENNVPVKLNFSKLNVAKASTLSLIYKEYLKDLNNKTKSIRELKATNLDLFNKITQTLATEIELLGGNVSTIQLQNLVEVLVLETSSKEKSNKAIVFKKDNEGFNYIEYNNKIFTEDNIDELANDLQLKYHNVITLTSAINVNKKLNFKNPQYLKYLFDNSILSTNLNTKGYSFKNQTTSGDLSKNRGAELWMSSSITNNKKVEVAPVIETSEVIDETEIVDNVIAEYNKQIIDLLAMRDPENDTIKGPLYFIDSNNQLSTKPIEVVYNDKGIIVSGNLLPFNMIKKKFTDEIQKNLKNKPLIQPKLQENQEIIRNSEKNSVSLQDNNIIMNNKVDIPGTPENKDYREAFKNLQVKGENILKKENLEKSLKIAEDSLETLRKVRPQKVQAQEEKIKGLKKELTKLAEDIKKQQNC